MQSWFVTFQQVNQVTIDGIACGAWNYTKEVLKSYVLTEKGIYTFCLFYKMNRPNIGRRIQRLIDSQLKGSGFAP